jgi:hydrogenase maturation protease
MQNDSNDGERSPAVQADSVHPTTLVIGLGNPILGDDGVGWRVVDKVAAYLNTALTTPGPLAALSVEVDQQALGGLSLMERVIGYERVIIVDAITTRQSPQGSVTCLPLESLPDRSTGHLTAAHDTSLQTALRVAVTMGGKVPKEIIIVGIESEQVFEFTEELSPPVEAAVPEAQTAVIEILKTWALQTEECKETRL